MGPVITGSFEKLAPGLSLQVSSSFGKQQSQV